MEFAKKILKMSSPLRSIIFSNFWHFSYLLLLFLTCRCSRQKHGELQKFYYAISLQYLVSRQ